MERPKFLLRHTCAASRQLRWTAYEQRRPTRTSMKSKTQHGGMPMFVKITIAVALVFATASGALAASKPKHNTKRAHDLYETHRQYGGRASRAHTVHANATRLKGTHSNAAH